MVYLYNSLTRQKEIFKLSNKGKRVTLYTCGPTVYDFAHLGNLRYFVCVDILRRFLEYSGYRVRQITNITDVGHMTTEGEAGEDKVEAASQREGLTPRQLTEKYTEAFFHDVKLLNILPAQKYPRASEHVKEMVRLVKKLLDSGHAYKVGGSVYFDLSKFPRYGRLSGNTIADLLSGARVEVIKEKRQPYDFALWIANPKHLMQWSAPWGRGYPGWHIECSAMAMKYLGETIDLHTGGEDNKFPHHECEIAQSEAATGRQFARYWFHVKHLLVDGEKMSKSKGNFYTLSDILAKGFTPRALRYLLLSAHYRDTLNFTFDSLKAAAAALSRLDEFWQRLSFEKKEDRRQKTEDRKVKQNLKNLIEKARREFNAAMNDDLDTPKALAALFIFVREANVILERGGAAKVDLRSAQRLLKSFDEVLGLGFLQARVSKISAVVRVLVKKREAARAAKDWTQADVLRKEIEAAGFTVEDTPQGPKLKKK